jgi:reductive dehalogenase
MKELDSNTETSKPVDSKVTKGLGRRNFFKVGIAGTGLAVGGAAGLTIVRRMEGIPHEYFPMPVKDDFKPIDQRNVILTFAASKTLNEKHPERIRKFGNFHFYERYKNFRKGPFQNTPGYTQLDRALAVGGWSSLQALHGPYSLSSPDGVVGSWEQTMLWESKYKFTSEKEASIAIKSAAKLYGALNCGITRRDRRWDYEPLYDPAEERELSWEKDFPFQPKTVVVILAEMDYLAMSTAPSWVTDATVGNAYSDALKIAGQVAIFLRQLGYKAVASMNDMGINGPYAVAAGLGEAARNGQVITPKHGPRIRISKVYTDLDFVECDKPRTYGVASFCKNCKRCADSCPSKAITFDDPSWEPTYSDDPDYIWHAAPGVFKFHKDAKKCFRFWTENDGGCANCICSCPYNKPDFWHHRLVDAQNVVAPGPVHRFMRFMDEIFGYGKVSEPKHVLKFWNSGDKA